MSRRKNTTRENYLFQIDGAIELDQSDQLKKTIFEKLFDKFRVVMVCHKTIEVSKTAIHYVYIHISSEFESELYMQTNESSLVEQMVDYYSEEQKYDVSFSNGSRYALLSAQQAVANEVQEVRNLRVVNVKNVANTLVTCTLHDAFVLYKNIDETELSLFFRVAKFARSRILLEHELKSESPCDINNSFFVSLGTRAGQAYKSYLGHLTDYFSKNKPSMPQMTLDVDDIKESDGSVAAWKEKVRLWWNSWCTGDKYEKKPQLYLYGASDTGKSSLVRKVLSRIPAINIFRPISTSTAFCWQEFNPNLHVVCVIEEFDVRNFDFNSWKIVAAGEVYIANVKNKSPKEIQLQVPMIMISNEEPPSIDSNRYTGFCQRVVIVESGGRIVGSKNKRNSIYIDPRTADLRNAMNLVKNTAYQIDSEDEN